VEDANGDYSSTCDWQQATNTTASAWRVNVDDVETELSQQWGVGADETLDELTRDEVTLLCASVEQGLGRLESYLYLAARGAGGGGVDTC